MKKLLLIILCVPLIGHTQISSSGLSINNSINWLELAEAEKLSEKYTWLIIKLREGKNREIRKICDYFSWDIVKLIRIKYGPYKLLDLKKNV